MIQRRQLPCTNCLVACLLVLLMTQKIVSRHMCQDEAHILGTLWGLDTAQEGRDQLISRLCVNATLHPHQFQVAMVATNASGRDTLNNWQARSPNTS